MGPEQPSACAPTESPFAWLPEALDTWELKDSGHFQAKVPISHGMEQEFQVQSPALPCQDFCCWVGALSGKLWLLWNRWCLPWALQEEA